ncbi:BnaA09g02200D [Brassica napus]|uniref:WAT1-related protein n=1 Tax=Brassica napus TaxID=3708 RepID=A0A078G3W8_BRANA|nr:BnaA09g02200D [Brassica napus]
MAGKYFQREVLPVMALVIMECANVGLNTLFKAATLQGMSFHVFIVYSYGLAALLLLPSIFFSSRSRTLPPMNFSILYKIVVLGLIGCCSNIMGYTGINYSSPTLASAISNLTPAFTFLLAILFRLMESVSFKRISSVAKMLGTVVSIGGAFIVTLYNGPLVISMSPPSVSLRSQSTNHNWIIGAAFLSVEYFMVPLWYIVQTQIMREYPSEFTVVCYYSLGVSFWTGLVTLFTEGSDLNAWKIKPNIALVSIVCSGVFGSCINNTIHTWALRIKGPLFVAMFKPLSIAIAVAMGVIFLHDSLYIGSLIGATVITTGFYTVMWGKAKEAAMVEDDNKANNEDATNEADHDSPLASQKAPLLESYKNDEHV